MLRRLEQGTGEAFAKLLKEKIERFLDGVGMGRDDKTKKVSGCLASQEEGERMVLWSKEGVRMLRKKRGRCKYGKDE